MSILNTSRRYQSYQHDGVLHIEHRRWWLGGRLVNACFHDGKRWHQADAHTMQSLDRLDAWLQSLHRSMLR